MNEDRLRHQRLRVGARRADAALRRPIEDEHGVLISKPIVDELLRVLARKFARVPDELSRVALFVDDLCEMVLPEERVRDLADDADNRILECALAGLTADAPW